jgi:hypothetical protein
MKQLSKAQPKRAAFKETAKRALRALLLAPLVASLAVGCNSAKKFREIEPGPDAKAFYECQRGFKTKGLYNNKTFIFEVSDIKGRKTPCVKLVCESRPDKGENSYGMIDFNNDLKPDRIVFFCIKNIEGTKKQANLNMNTLRRKANALGDTIFTSDKENFNGFSKAEMRQIFADGEATMKGVYRALKVEEKLRTWKSPFRK